MRLDVGVPRKQVVLQRVVPQRIGYGEDTLGSDGDQLHLAAAHLLLSLSRGDVCLCWNLAKKNNTKITITSETKWCSKVRCHIVKKKNTFPQMNPPSAACRKVGYITHEHVLFTKHSLRPSLCDVPANFSAHHSNTA